jgi:hypothetical protein
MKVERKTMRVENTGAPKRRNRNSPASVFPGTIHRQNSQHGDRKKTKPKVLSNIAWCLIVAVYLAVTFKDSICIQAKDMYEYYNYFHQQVELRRQVKSLRHDHCGGIVQSLSGGQRIPHNLIFNSKGGLKHEHALLQDNTKSIQTLFPGWRVIDDTDLTCLEKLLAIDFMKSATSEIKQWYTAEDTPGAYKSDVCRLAQLYQHGGIYL